MVMDNGEINYKDLVDIIVDIFDDYKSYNSSNGQVSVCCPVCSYDIKNLDKLDGKYNLEINVRLGVFKCWSCSETHNTHGSIYKLIKKYGTDRHLKRFELLKPDDFEVTIKPKKDATLPKEFVPLNNVSDVFKMTHYYRQVMSYIRKRNITDAMIRKFNIGFAYDGPFSNRVIIPSYDECRKLNYFIARSYLTKPKIKYKNPDVQKETIIFNESLIDWTKKIYLVEGAFDSIFLDNSIPMLGKYISDLLFNKIYDLQCEVTIVLDGDAWDDTEKLYHKLNCGKLMGKINVIKLPIEKDIADLKGDLTEYKEFKLD
jgi:DNA primase